MTNPNTAVGQRWAVQLERAAGVLRQFQQAGVPVMFRPLHEQNGTFFWWGHDFSSGENLRARQEAWVSMWRHLVREMANRHGLNNLLYVFGTNQVNYDGVAAPLTYYPGGDWADIVTIDVYNNQLNMAGSERGLQHYSALLSTGKPFGFAEFGQAFDGNGTGWDAAQWDARTLVTRINDSFPRTAFAIAWYSSFEGGNSFLLALPDVSYSRELLQHPLIQTQ
jgi:mannan endo-1,4-beta-mannosidase